MLHAGLTQRLRLTTALTVLGGAAFLAALAAPGYADEAAQAKSGDAAAQVQPTASGGPVTQERLENADAEPQNWLTTFQNYQAHRYSRLDEINRDNVGGLKVAFTLPVTTGIIGRTRVDLENPPMVDDGIMYFDDGAGVFYKVDVRSGTKGQVLWRADAAVSKDEANRTRGIALWNNAIYHNLADGRVVAVDRDSGEFLFDEQIARVSHPKGSNLNLEKESFTAAPLAVEGKILVGNSAGDAGTNGWLAAVDAETGKELWRTYTIPGPGEPGHETWADDHGAWKTGGGALWTTGSYDPEQKLIIWGTAQPGPMHDPEFRPGDNLFTNSAVAFDIETGAIKWHFQYVPNESWDYDEQGVHQLIDAKFDGADRKMVLHWGRNGFVYQLDRTNGQFLTAEQFVDEVNWTAGIDPKTGKPLEYDPSLAVQEYVPEYRMVRGEEQGDPICPHRLGGVRWQTPAYNPDTKVSYIAARDGCSSFANLPVDALADGGIDPKGAGGFHGVDRPNIKDFGVRGIIAAADVTTGKVIGKYNTHYDNQSGVLATSGGLIFTATVDGTISAHDDKTLEELWSFNTGIGIKAPPISYSVDGKQYIAIMAGGNVTQAGWADAFPELATQLIPGAMLYVFAL